MTIVKTKCIYAPKEESDGLRLLVTRFWPRGRRKDEFSRWEQALSPSKELLLAYREGRVDWPMFEQLFRSEAKQSRDFTRALRDLIDFLHASPGINVALLCFEREGEHCHRHIVGDMLIENLAFGAL